MRGAFLCLWLLVPAVALAYHYGPGQERMRSDNAGSALRQAKACVAAGDWAGARAAYDEALAQIPATNMQAIREVRLARANAMMEAQQLPEAYDELFSLSEELAADKTAPEKLVKETRNAQAGAQYYMTWLMRL